MQRGGYDHGRGRAPATHAPKEGNLKTQLVEALNKGMDRMMAVLPKHFTPEKTIQIVTICAIKTPGLLHCDPLTFVNAIVTAGSLGLDINPTAGEAWLIPRKGKVVFQPGYRGLAKLMKSGGEVDTVQCRLVYRNEIYIREYNPDLLFRHVPDDFGDMHDDDIVLAYCDVKTHSGDRLIEVMNRKQILASRDRGRAGTDGPWVTDFAAMAKRCPIVPMSKWITLTPPLQKAFEALYEEVDPENAAVQSVVKRGAGAFRERIGGGDELRGLPAPPADEPEEEERREASAPPPRRASPPPPPVPPPAAPPAPHLADPQPGPRRESRSTPPLEPRHEPIGPGLLMPDPDEEFDDIPDGDLYDDDPPGPEDVPDELPAAAPPPVLNFDQFMAQVMGDWQAWWQDEYQAEGFTKAQMGPRHTLIDYRDFIHAWVSLGIEDDAIKAEDVTAKNPKGIIERVDFKCIETLRKHYAKDPGFFQGSVQRILTPRAANYIETAQAEAKMKTSVDPPWVDPKVAERALQAAAPADPPKADPPKVRRGRRAPADDSQPELPVTRN